MRIRWFGWRRRNTAPPRPHGTNARPYREGGPYRGSGPDRPTNLPAWMTQPTLAEPQPGRVGWLTPAQQWRANGGRW